MTIMIEKKIHQHTIIMKIDSSSIKQSLDVSEIVLGDQTTHTMTQSNLCRNAWL